MKPGKTTLSKRTTVFQAENRAAARIVAADVQRHGGEAAALVQWARAVLGASERSTAQTQPHLPGLGASK